MLLPDLAHELRKLEVTFTEEDLLLADLRVEANGRSFLLVDGRLGVLLPEKDRKFVEHDGYGDVNPAVLDFTERRRCLDCVSAFPLEDKIRVAGLLGLSLDATNLGLDDHCFLLSFSEQALDVSCHDFRLDN